MSGVDEIWNRLEAAKGKEVVMDFHLYVDAAVRAAVIHGTSDLYWRLARVKKLEGLLDRLAVETEWASGILHIDYDAMKALLPEARTLLADESEDNEHAGI